MPVSSQLHAVSRPMGFRQTHIKELVMDLDTVAALFRRNMIALVTEAAERRHRDRRAELPVAA